MTRVPTRYRAHVASAPGCCSVRDAYGRARSAGWAVRNYCHWFHDTLPRLYGLAASSAGLSGNR